MLCQKTEKLGPTYKIIIAYFLVKINQFHSLTSHCGSLTAMKVQV